MSRFLLTLWPFTGHLHPNLALASELKRRGHRVAFYSGVKVQEAIERAGFDFFPLQRVNERRIEEIALSPDGLLSALNNPFRQKKLWQEWVLDSVPDQVNDIEQVIARWQPDAIICDPTVWGPFLILAEHIGIPVIVFSLIPACYLSGEKAPIMGFPIRPPVGRLQRARSRMLRALSDFGRRSIRRRANELRQDFGLAPLDCSVTDLAGRMPLYLVPGSRSFDYGRTGLPASVHYVGPCLWKEPRQEQLPDFIRRLPAGEPVIYASEGTIHHEPKLLQAVIRGLAGRPVQVIATTGRHRDPANLDLGVDPLPSNMHVRQWIPLGPLLPHLNAIVTIGGPSTLLAGLSAGIPAVVVPFYWDHPETGLRLEASGAGISISPRRCTPERIREAVETVLRNPSYRENARRLAADFDADGSPGRAASLIETLLLAGATTQRIRIGDR